MTDYVAPVFVDDSAPDLDADTMNGIAQAAQQAHARLTAIESGAAQTSSGRSTLTRVAAVALAGHRVVTPDHDGLVYADRAEPLDFAAPLWVTTGATGPGAQATVVTAGLIVEPSWSWTPGPVWLGTNGALTQTLPTVGFIAQVGAAISPTELVVDRQPSIRLA